LNGSKHQSDEAQCPIGARAAACFRDNTFDSHSKKPTFIGANAMAQTTKLECRHCDFSKQTSDNIPPGKSIACPRCRVPMEIIRPAGAIEDEKAPSFTDDLEPILSTRSARMKAAQKRALVSNRPPPFHQSRSFIAAVSVTAISLVVLVLFVLYRDTIGQLSRGMKDIESNRKKIVQNNVVPKPGKTKGGQTNSTNTAPANQVAGKKKEDPGPVVAPAETKVGDLVVSVSTASLVRIDGSANVQCLVLKLKITNTSQMPITFLSRSQPNIPVVLRDTEGKLYDRLGPLPPDETVIDPNQLFVDSIAFEEPAFGVEMQLEIPFPGGERPVHFRLPSRFIKRTMDVLRLGNLGQQPATAALPASSFQVADRKPHDPKKDLPHYAEVNADYQAGVDKLQVRSRGKGSNEAMLLLKRGKISLVNDLAKKYNLPADQIRRMIDEP
jgi:hypothetical protein